MATILKPDKVGTLGDITVNEYMLTKHNPNKIAMPTAALTDVIGVTVHNTDWITVAAGTTPAEQYTRATVNGNMNSVRVHYYVDDQCAWQNLPLTLSGWHAADGNGNGNRKTIAIECIMSGAYNDKDKKSEDNCAKLAAALLKQLGLGVDHLYTHTHWLNVRDGKTGSVDYLNTAKNSYKNCPAFILPHWEVFKAKVASYLNADSTTPQTSTVQPENTTKKEMYRVRLSWSNVASQIGAYSSLDNAKAACEAGYTVYNSNGEAVYSKAGQAKALVKGTKVRLSGKLYASATTKTGIAKTGVFYVYDGIQSNGRYRITISSAYCGRVPVGMYVTGWANKNDLTVV